MPSNRRRRINLSPSMAVALVALFVALGGTSYAVVSLPARSVGSAQLKAESVTRAAVRDGAITGAKVGNDSLTGADVREATLAPVPSALVAGRAPESDHAVRSDSATTAALLDKVSYRVAGGSVPRAVAVDEPSVAAASATCDAGQHAVGGGVKVEDGSGMLVADTHPDGGGRAWTVRVSNADAAAAHGFTVYVACIPTVNVG